MAIDDKARTRRAARGFGAVTALAVLAVQPGVALGEPTLPQWPPLDILSGSADAPAAARDVGSATTGSAVEVGPGSSAVTGLDLGSSSGGAGSNFRGVAADLGLGQTGSAATDIGVPPVEPVAGTAGELLGLEPGSVLTACAGSAVLGSAALALGSVTGSALVGLGSSGSGWVGAGSGLLVPGLLIGPGSVGGGTGSVVVGSAALGSALLTCLLLLPVPDVPGIPLQLGSPSPVAAPLAPEQPPAPEFVPPATVLPPPPKLPVAEPLPPVPTQKWSVLQMMTVLIITIIAGARVKAAKALRR